MFYNLTMKVFSRKDKTQRGPGNFYFGDYGEIPIGISQTRIDEKNIDKSKDTLHYHKQGIEFYLTIEGKAVLEVEGNQVELNENQLVMVEPGEKHYVKQVTQTPFSVISICTTKDPDDKIVV